MTQILEKKMNIIKTLFMTLCLIVCDSCSLSFFFQERSERSERSDYNSRNVMTQLSKSVQISAIGIFWNILEKIGIFWKKLEYFGKNWNILEKIGIFWKNLEYFGKYWIFRNFLEYLIHPRSISSYIWSIF